MKHLSRQRPGVVLLLSLLLMAAIVSSTIAIATAVADATHQSKSLDDFLLASLAADSGLERALDVIKVGRASGATIVSSSGGAAQTGATVGSVATVNVASTANNQPVSIPRLEPNQTVTFDDLFYDPTNGQLKTISSASASLQVVGNAQGCGLATCDGRLEVSWLGLDPSGQPFYSGRYVIQNSSLNGVNPVSFNLTTNVSQPNNDSPPTNIGSTTGFRITIRALDVNPHPVGLSASEAITYLTVSNISVTVPNPPTCNAGPPAVPCISGVINLTSTGTVANSQAIKQANVLWQPPVSSLFNYVVFTEGDIIPGT